MKEREEGAAFRRSLHNFTFDVAARGSIRHLASLGYSPEEIREHLSFPVSLSRIREELRQMEKEEKENAGGAPAYDYVKETDAYGRTSFRRVLKEKKE